MNILVTVCVRFTCLLNVKGYKLEDARHLTANDCVQCSDSNTMRDNMGSITFDTTNRGQGQWFQENGIWKRRRPSDDKRKRVRFDRRLDPDAGVDPLDYFGL